MFLNMKLLAHHTLNGFGGMGEGMSIQIAKDGRRIIWLAHESAPKNFTAVDVSDPRKPQIVVQTDLPECKPTMVMRSIGLNYYESSKFNNELFFPSHVDTFFGSRPEARAPIRQVNTDPGGQIGVRPLSAQVCGVVQGRDGIDWHP
jgi:hypothetical protein